MVATINNVTSNENDPAARLKLILATNHPNEITALVDLKALATTQAHSQVQVSLCQCSLSNLSILEKVGEFVGAGAAVLLIDGRSLTDWSAAYIQFIQPLVDRHGPNRLPILWVLRKEQQEDFESGYHQQRYFNLREVGGVSTDLLWLSRLLPIDFFYPTEQSAGLLTSRLAHLLQVQGWRTNREQTQRQQKQNERDLLARITQLEAASYDAIISVDPDYKINSWNKGTERIYGYTAQEIIGKSIWILEFPEEDLNPADRLLLAGNTSYKAVLNPNGSGSWSGVAIHRSKSGQKLYIESTVTAIKTPQGDLVELIGINRDVTVQKEYEQELLQKQQELSESKHFLESVIEQSPIGIAVFDHEGVCIDVNMSCCRILGVDSPEFLIGHFNLKTDQLVVRAGTQPLIERVFKGEALAFPTKIYDFNQADSSYGMHKLNRVLRGNYFPIFGQASAGNLPDQRISGTSATVVRQVENVIVFLEDITDQQSLQNHLLQAQKLESLTTLVSTTVHDLKNLLAVSFLSLDELNFRLGNLGVAQDAQLKTSLAQLEQATLQGRTLLSQLMDLVYTNTLGQPALKQAQATSARNGEYTSNWIEWIEVEDFFEKTGGLLKQAAGKNTNFSLEVKATNYFHFENSNGVNTVNPQEPGDTKTLKVPGCHIDQVLLNLVANARDALCDAETTLPQPAITVRTFNARLEKLPKPGYQDTQNGEGAGVYTAISSHTTYATHNYTVLEVEDNGPGICREKLAQIFEPLFTTKPKGKGTGLGLASCYTIANLYNGWLEVASRPGKGTIFSLYLPYEAENFSEAAPSVNIPATQERAELLPHWMEGETTHPATKAVPLLAETNPRGNDTTQKKGILLVEDNEKMRQIFARLLKQEGWNVFEAESAEKALGIYLLHDAQIEALLTDVELGGLSGVRLAEMLLSENPRLQVIVMSVGIRKSEDQSGLDRLIARRQVSFLAKPFENSKLFELLLKLDNKQAA